MISHHLNILLYFRYRRALRKARQEEKAKNEDPEEANIKADLARVQERASLKHKTISKKLRFYDQTNTKESEVVSIIRYFNLKLATH